MSKKSIIVIFVNVSKGDLFNNLEFCIDISSDRD
jgi:hypothetical protein